MNSRKSIRLQVKENTKIVIYITNLTPFGILEYFAILYILVRLKLENDIERYFIISSLSQRSLEHDQFFLIFSILYKCYIPENVKDNILIYTD